MTMFTPGLAVAGVLAAVGVPLLIHLLFRRRYRIVPWAAIRFLLVAERRHHRRLEQWLLLLLRILVLALPLGAMVAATDWAEPLWQHLWPNAGQTLIRAPRTHHVIILDRSLSLTAQPEGAASSRWEAVKRQAAKLLEQAGAGDSFTVVAVGEGAETIVPGPAQESDRVMREIYALPPSHGNTPLAAALPLIHEALDRSPASYPRKQVTFITDLQQSAWQGILRSGTDQHPVAESWQRLADRAEIVLLDVAQHDTDNLCVADLSISEPAPLVQGAVSATAVVANYGQREYRNLVVQLLVGRPGSDYERPAAREQVLIAHLPPGGRVTVTFGQQNPLRFTETGQHLVLVQVSSGDALAADDRRGVVVSVRAAIPVLLVEGRPEASLQRRTAGDLQRALLPDSAAAEWTPARPRMVTVTEFLDPALGALDEYEAVYLCDLPLPSPEWVPRLEAFARKGGSILLGLGPQAGQHLQDYNRVLHKAGRGLLPFPLEEVVGLNSTEGASYRLAAEEDAFRQPLLALFRDERVRGGLINVPFRRYVRVRPTPESGVKRWLDFVPARGTSTVGATDPALLEWRWHKGRVFLFTSSFNEDWNDWPPLPTYLPFHQELLRYAAVPADRHTLEVGDTLEEFYPLPHAGLAVQYQPPEGESGRSVLLVAEEQAAVVRIPGVSRSGLHQVVRESGERRIFWVNTPPAVPGQPTESNLKRLNPAELAMLQPVQVVGDASEIVPSSDSGAEITILPHPQGPRVARGLILAGLLVLLAEMVLAWRWGPAAGASPRGALTSAPRLHRGVTAILGGAIVPLTLAIVGLVAVLWISDMRGTLAEGMPPAWREFAHRILAVPDAPQGETSTLRLERAPVFTPHPSQEGWGLLALVFFLILGTVWIYRRERLAASWGALWLPALLRAVCWAWLVLLILPQWRTVYDREGWPDLVILLDVSRSMNHSDNYRDAAVRARVDALLRELGSSSAARWQLVQHLLADSRQDGLARLLRRYKVKLHIYCVDETLRPVATVEEEGGLDPARQAVEQLRAEGNASRLGDGVHAVLKAFRGSPLAGIIVFTDGVVTEGEEWSAVAAEAARAGVPLYLVGIGDVWEAPDLILSDLQVEETVMVGDRLVFDVRLSYRGTESAGTVPVVLYEKDKASGQLIERSRVAAAPPLGGAPVPVTISYTPTEPGEKVFIVQVPPVPGETLTSNNRLERTVWVTEARRVRVLMIEGRPRYDFRFIKVLLERESEHSLGGRHISVDTILLNASPGWAETDRSAFRSDFPTREQLFGYDVILLGDIDPRRLPHVSRTLQDLSEFVTVKGGGLLFLCGAHFTPAAWADTPLAAILPVTVRAPSSGESNPPPEAIQGYRPRLTELGQQHPIFRFHPDLGESLRVWEQLPPLYWYARGYQRKPQTSVLATLPPSHPNESEPHPLVLQMFAGSGMVLFFGFDDTWRWRWRQQEEYFDRFWLQAIRFLARFRVRRPELKVTPKAEFRRDETMKVVVRFPVDAPPPAAQQAVRVTVQRRPLNSPHGSSTPETGETTTLTLARVPGPIPQYETVLTRVSEGDYQFTLIHPEAPPGQQPPTASARVLPPWAELDRIDLNRKEMVEAAARSGGQFFSLAEVDRLWTDLPPPPRVPLSQAEPLWPLWNLPWVYLILIGIVGSEWLLRKRARLL
jgi:hypothetical protein